MPLAITQFRFRYNFDLPWVCNPHALIPDLPIVRALTLKTSPYLAIYGDNIFFINITLLRFRYLYDLPLVCAFCVPISKNSSLRPTLPFHFTALSDYYSSNLRFFISLDLSESSLHPRER